MNIRKVRISENRYNSTGDVGTIMESSVNITMTSSLFGEEVIKLTKDKILYAYFKRSFLDKKLDYVTVSIPAPVIDNVEALDECIQKVMKPEYEIIKDEHFNLEDYISKFTISINDGEIEYEITKSSELGQRILILSGLATLITMTNNDVINSIDI